MCLKAAGPWVAGWVEGFGQVPRAVITSHNLGFHTGKQPRPTETLPDR